MSRKCFQVQICLRTINAIRNPTATDLQQQNYSNKVPQNKCFKLKLSIESQHGFVN